MLSSKGVYAYGVSPGLLLAERPGDQALGLEHEGFRGPNVLVAGPSTPSPNGIKACSASPAAGGPGHQLGPIAMLGPKSHELSLEERPLPALDVRRLVGVRRLQLLEEGPGHRQHVGIQGGSRRTAEKSAVGGGVR